MINGKKVWAVICGSIRQEMEFYSVITWLCERRFKHLIDGIVFSTWSGEIDKFEGLRDKLNLLDVKVVESLPVGEDIKKYMNYVYTIQAVQLRAGLKILPDDVFVLKCRTDFCMRWLQRIDHVLDGNVDLSIRTYGSFNCSLSYRIAVMDFAFSGPFCLCDMVFLGHKNDLLKMIKFENTQYKYNDLLMPDCLFFFNLFRDEFPIIDSFLSVFKFWQFRAQWHTNLPALQNQEIVLPDSINKFYAMYIVILYCCFYSVQNPFSNPNIGSVDIMDIFRCSKKLDVRNEWVTILYNPAVIDKIIEGDINPTKGTMKIYNEITKIASQRYSKTVDITLEDYNSTVEFGKSFFKVEPLKWLNPFTKISNTNVNSTSGPDALNILLSDYAPNYEITDVLFEIIDGKFEDFYRAMSDCLDLLSKNKNLYDIVLYTVLRRQTPRDMKKISLMLLNGEIGEEHKEAAEYVFKRYGSGLHNFYGFPMRPERMAAIYYYGKYSEPHGDNLIPSKFYHELVVRFNLSPRCEPSSYADAVLETIIEIVNERYKEYKSNDSIKNMVDFLGDEMLYEKLSKSARDYLNNFIIQRRYSLPFGCGESSAFDKLLMAASKTNTKEEAFVIAKLLIRESSGSSQEKRNGADAAIHLMMERGLLEPSPFLSVFLAAQDENLDTYFDGIEDTDDYILLLRILSGKKLLTAYKDKLVELYGADTCRLAYLALFLRIESDSRIHFFSTKSKSEMWVNYSDFLNSDINNHLLMIKNYDGASWPFSEKSSESPLAAYLRVAENNVFISIEFSSHQCRSKTDLLRALDKTGLMPFDMNKSLIWLKRETFPFGVDVTVETAVNQALDEFCGIGEAFMCAVKDMNERNSAE